MADRLITEVEPEKVDDTPARLKVLADAIAHDRDTYREDPEVIQVYRDYVRGKHRVALTERQIEILEGLADNGNLFSDNYAHEIVAQARDRVRFLGWDCENESVKEYLKDLYTKARIGARQSQIHYDTFRDGNHLVGLQWNKQSGRVQIFREPWWNGDEGAFAAYNRLDEMVYVVKDWLWEENEKEVIRRVVWFDDKLMRFISRDSGNSFEPYMLEEDAGKWPIPNTKRGGEPLHIPYIHFINSGRGEINYGSSELDGGLIGMIDHLIDSQFSQQANSRQSAYQIITATGVSTEDEETGEEVPIEVGPGQVLSNPNPAASFGHIPAGSSEGILSVYNSKRSRTAQMSRTPEHIFSGVWPSGEAIIKAEGPAIGKAEAQILELTDKWIMLGHRAIELRNRWSNEPPLEEDIDKAKIDARFAKANQRDVVAVADAVSKAKEIVSHREALRLLGYDEDQIDLIMEERDEELTKMMETQQAMFNKGIGPGNDLFTEDNQEADDTESEEDENPNADDNEEA